MAVQAAKLTASPAPPQLPDSTSARSKRPAPDPDRPVTSLRDVLRRRPGWPLVVLFVGYPLWWVLGIADVVGLFVAGAMAYTLLRTRTVRIPRGFGIFLLFLLWVVLGAALVQVAAPGAVATVSSTRYLTWLWRLVWYVKAGVLLLYLGNMRKQLSVRWICRVFSAMFIVIVAGGLLGVVAPNFQFHSALELVLPHHIATIPFIHSEIHPVAAESFTSFIGTGGRTSAPFPYANVWGLNFACFLPFFVVGWLARGCGWRRVVGPMILAVAAIPVIYSLNRGLWLALAAAAVFVAIRSLVAGRPRILGSLVIGLGLATIVVLASPLHTKIEDRLHSSGPSSNAGRAELSSLTLSSMRSTSPLLGFGTTRQVQGNFNSINGGATASCPRCVLPAMGTQGQFSLVVFTQGIGGVVLYFGFLFLQFLRYIRMRTAVAIAMLSVLLMHFVTSTVYSADNLALLAIFGAVAVLWRARAEEVLADKPGVLYAADEPTLGGYAARLRLHWRSLVALALVGLLGGALFAHRAGSTYLATVSVFAPQDPTYSQINQLPPTIDAVAGYAKSDATLAAMRQAAGRGVQADRLVVTATVNTRLLHLTYSGASAATARSAVTAAAQAVIAQRAQAQQARLKAAVGTLQGQYDATSAALDTVRSLTSTPHSSAPLASLIGRLQAQESQVGLQLLEIGQLPVPPATVTSVVAVRVEHDRLKVDLADGLAIALLVWFGWVALASAATPRLGRRLRLRQNYGLPVLAEGPSAGIDIDSLVWLARPGACVAAGRTATALALAAQVDGLISREGRQSRRVVLVAARRDRVALALRMRRRLERGGASVAGLVIVDPPSAGQETLP